jgi:hypothetical protein
VKPWLWFAAGVVVGLLIKAFVEGFYASLLKQP